MENSTESRRRLRSLLLVFSFAAALIVLLWGVVQTAFISPLTVAGYKDFSFDDPELFPNEKMDAPTGEKPESKLWWNDGYWWGILYNPDTDHYHIYRLDWGEQEWVDTGVQVDDRRADPFAVPPKPPEKVKVDVLWDDAAQKLYVVSHVFTQNGSRTSNSRNRGFIFRYSYDKVLQQYTLDTLDGFTEDGIQVNEHKTETLVITKDSNDRLWTAFVARPQGSSEHQVIVTYSDGNDAVWAKDGFTLPFTQAFTSQSDIATIFPFNDGGTPSIGILWTNEVSNTVHLAVHPDGANPTSGWTYELVPDPYGIDDHIAVRTDEDADGGRIFVAVKMSPMNANDPQVAILARDNDISHTWSIIPYSTKLHDDTRPFLMIDENDPLDDTDDELHLFVTGREGGSDLCYKTASIDHSVDLAGNMSFPNGDCGTPFIMDDILDRIDDGTSTKQPVTDDMGLVVMASDSTNGLFYVHNAVGDPVPVVYPFGPARGAVGVQPTIAISATFNKPMNSATIDGSSFIVEDSMSSPVAGTVSYDDAARVAYFTPALPLKANETYTAKLTSGVQDTGGKTLNQGIEAEAVRESWSFTVMSPTVQFSNASFSVLENVPQATVTLTLSSASALPVTVEFATADNTALAGSDYTAVPSTTVTFLANETVKTVTVPMLDDLVAEGDESFFVRLSNPVNASVGLVSESLVTIFDNEVEPTVQFSVSDFQAAEESGQAQVTVSLFPTSTSTINVDVASVADMGDATPGADYTAVPTQTLSFAPGEQQKVVMVTLTDDTLDELNEKFYMNLGNVLDPAGLVTPTIGLQSQASVTIVDNDMAPTVRFSAPQFNVAENAGVAPVEVTLSAASGLTVTVNYATSDGAARDPQDYLANSGMLTFLPGETSKMINVVLVEDTMDENDEDFEAQLTAPVNATLGATSTTSVLIQDNDDAPTVGFELGSYLVDETAGTADVIVTLSAASGKLLTVDYATSDGTAVSGDDYTGSTGTLTFSPGTITQTLSIDVLDDVLGEGAETFDVTLSNPGPTANDLSLGAQSSTEVTIDDDDGVTVGFEMAGVTVTEDALLATVEVHLSAASTTQVTVDYSMMDGTAVAGQDYTDGAGTLTFAPGQTIQTIQVPITDDLRDEETETFQIMLSNPTDAFMGGIDTIIVSIDDNDDGNIIVFMPFISRQP